MRMRMRTNRVLAFAVLAASAVVTRCEGEWSLVEETCKRTAYTSLCVATLESSPGIGEACDVRAVANIMTEAVLSKAAETLEAFRAVLRSGGSEDDERSLAFCAQLFIPVVKYTLPQAIDALTAGHFGFAGYGISDAAKQAASCTAAVSSSGGELARQSDLLARLSQIAASIVHLLLQP